MRTAGAIGAAAVLLIAGCDDSPGGPGFSSLEDFSELPAFEEARACPRRWVSTQP